MPQPTESPATAQALAEGMAVGGFVEAGLSPSAHFATCLADGGMAVLLTTRAAHALPVASLLSAAAAARWGLSEDCRHRLDIVLHEAIANAVLHGNLAIGPTPTLAERFARIEAGLADPGPAALPVEATVCPCPEGLLVTVTDGGHGFDLAARLGRTAPADAQSGRGLTLIKGVARSLASQDGGRTLSAVIDR